MSWEKDNKQRRVTRQWRAWQRGAVPDITGKFTPKLTDLHRAAQHGRDATERHGIAKVTLPIVQWSKGKGSAND